MAIDALSIAAILVSLLVIVVVFVIATRFNRDLDRKLRKLARNQEVLLNSAEARELCKAIRAQYPQACPGLDFSVDQEGSDLPRIVEWRLDGPKPDERELLKRSS
jgi:siroheme synthase (precorrin-2 oxidase/ferrochelatase)